MSGLPFANSMIVGYRMQQLRRRMGIKRNITCYLVFSSYFLALSFILSAAIVEIGQGLRTYRLCYSAIFICLIFYTWSKLIMCVTPSSCLHSIQGKDKCKDETKLTRIKATSSS